MFKQELLLLKYNKDVVCVIDKDQYPVCVPLSSARRRSSLLSNIPSHDPYIPRSHSLFYNCTSLSCEPIKLYSLTQVTSPTSNLRSCFQQSPGKFECDDVRYNHFKNIDKLLFLRNNIENKKFYMVDCLIYLDNERVCHAKAKDSPHTELVDVGALVRPNETNVLSQEEFICEETDDKKINCDLDPYVPFESGLKLKQFIKIKGDILLKSGTYVVMLKRNCIDSWCGYSGSVKPISRGNLFSRRSGYSQIYEPPGGKVFRCYYAKRQQVCKLLYDSYKPVYNERTYIAA